MLPPPARLFACTITQVVSVQYLVYLGVCVSLNSSFYLGTQAWVCSLQLLVLRCEKRIGSKENRDDASKALFLFQLILRLNSWQQETYSNEIISRAKHTLPCNLMTPPYNADQCVCGVGGIIIIIIKKACFWFLARNISPLPAVN